MCMTVRTVLLLICPFAFRVGCGGVSSSLGARPLHRAQEPPGNAKQQLQCYYSAEEAKQY